MDLQEFVQESLRQIIVGVHNAKKSAETKAEVAPAGAMATVANSPIGLYRTIYDESGERVGIQFTQDVSFDVAITIVEESEKQGGGKLQVLGISAGGEKKSNKSSSSVSRVQFTVPVFLP